MRRTMIAVVVLATGLMMTLGGLSQPAGAKGFTRANRFAPSGTVTVDPLTTPKVSASALARIAAAIPPSAKSGGCADHSQTNVRANQECTNQAAIGFFGRGQSQNETAVAVNPRNPDNVLISQNDYRFGDGRCGVDWSLDGGHTKSQLVPLGLRRRAHGAAPLLGCGWRYVGELRLHRRGLPDVSGLQPGGDERPRRQRQRALRVPVPRRGSLVELSRIDRDRE